MTYFHAPTIMGLVVENRPCGWYGSREIKIALIPTHVLLKYMTCALAIAQHRVLNRIRYIFLNMMGTIRSGSWVVETVFEFVSWYIIHIKPIWLYTHLNTHTHTYIYVGIKIIWFTYDTTAEKISWGIEGVKSSRRSSRVLHARFTVVMCTTTYVIAVRESRQ